VTYQNFTPRFSSEKTRTEWQLPRGENVSDHFHTDSALDEQTFCLWYESCKIETVMSKVTWKRLFAVLFIQCRLSWYSRMSSSRRWPM